MPTQIPTSSLDHVLALQLTVAWAGEEQGEPPGLGWWKTSLSDPAGGGDFVDRLVEGMTSFLLGGRAWTVQHVTHGDRTIRVGEAPRGIKPSWSAFTPQMLGFTVCQEMRRILVSQATYPYLHPTAAKALREKREELGELLGRSARPVQVEAGKAFWWTFAGGRINYTLKYALEVIGGWKVVADNLLLRIEGDGVTHGAIDAVVDRIAGEAFWQDAGMWRAIVARLPEYRLSKFQRALPEAASVELVGGYMLDAAGTRAYLGVESGTLVGLAVRD